MLQCLEHIHAHICHAVGNPQQLGQKPLTFNRYVIALCSSPDLLANPKAAELFPADAIARARELMGYVGSVGAYSDSRGAAGIRQEVASFIERRDGCAACWASLHADSSRH
jgi:glutamate--glyoxylate aminotransferase